MDVCKYWAFNAAALDPCRCQALFERKRKERADSPGSLLSTPAYLAFFPPPVIIGTGSGSAIDSGSVTVSCTLAALTDAAALLCNLARGFLLAFGYGKWVAGGFNMRIGEKKMELTYHGVSNKDLAFLKLRNLMFRTE